MTTASPPATRPPLPHSIDLSHLLTYLTDPSMRLTDIADELDISIAQLLDAAESPIVTSILSRMDKLDRRRARRAATAASPVATQTLELLTYDRAATPETRRKAATKILSVAAPTKKSHRAILPPSPLGGEGRGEGFLIADALRSMSSPFPRRGSAGEMGDWNRTIQPPEQRFTPDPRIPGMIALHTLYPHEHQTPGATIQCRRRKRKSKRSPGPGPTNPPRSPSPTRTPGATPAATARAPSDRE